MPLCFGASGSVRQRQNIMLASWAPEVHTFWPVMTTSSPSITPRVFRPARSEPASGSENPWQYRSSPLMIRGRKRAFCSSVPWTMIDGPTSHSPMPRVTLGTSARANSSFITATSMPVSPRPPNSLGHETHMNPASVSLSAHALSDAVLPKLARCSSTPTRSSGRLASSQPRTSSRNFLASGPRSSSMGISRLLVLRCWRRFEQGKVTAVFERLPRHPHGHPDPHLFGCAAGDVAHQPGTLGEVDQGHDVRHCVLHSRVRRLRHGAARVDHALARGRLPLQLRAEAAGAELPRVPHRFLARGAPLVGQPLLAGGVPERDRRLGDWRLQSLSAHPDRAHGSLLAIHGSSLTGRRPAGVGP